MTLEIEGISLEIPETIIENRQKYMFFDSLEDNVNSIKKQGSIFVKAYEKDDISKEELAKEFTNYLEELLETYIT